MRRRARRSDLRRSSSHYGELGIGYWCTHDSDVIPTEGIGKQQQADIVGGIKAALQKNDVKCSMVTTETFHHAVWAAGPAAESPEVREYAKFRVREYRRHRP